MGFSLEEIEDIKSTERLYVAYSNKHKPILRQILDKKVKEHQESIQTLNAQINVINVFEMNKTKVTDVSSIEMPFEVLNWLGCDKANDNFELSSSIINNKGIISAEINYCDKKYIIDKSLILSEQETQMALDIPSVDIRPAISNQHMVVFSECGIVISKVISDWDHSKGVVF